MTPYSQIRPAMRTGDVIAFSGKSRVSQIIKWKTGSPYSHVGIVLDNNISGGFGHSVLLMESTTLNNLPDSKSGELIKGVQMHFLSRRIETYNGEICWFGLQEKLTEAEAFAMQSWLREVHSKRVRYDALQAIGAGADLLDWIPGIENDEDFASLFCSELVGRALQIAGRVCPSLNSSEMTPADIIGQGCFSEMIQIEKEV